MNQGSVSSYSLHLRLGPSNTIVTCPYCKAEVKTAVEYTTTSRTHRTAASFACCLLCVYCCCDSAKNTDHYCPNCKRYLGTYEK